jgi:hypothetical protein
VYKRQDKKEFRSLFKLQKKPARGWVLKIIRGIFLSLIFFKKGAEKIQKNPARGWVLISYNLYLVN